MYSIEAILKERCMPVTWLKRKYRVGAAYSIQKSPNGNGGKGTSKKSNKRVKNQAPVVGHKVLFINMSGVDKFCPTSGKKLPVRGMVVEHKGVYYADFSASSKAGV